MPRLLEQHAAEEKAHTFKSVLGSGEDRHPAKQLMFTLPGVVRGFGNHGLDGALGAHLVEILGNAADRLRHHDIGHAPRLWPAVRHRHQHQQGRHLQQGARPECEPQAETPAEPAAIEIGEHTKKLIEEKQQRDLKRAVAKGVEMKHHQHAQGPIGEGEDPVVAGHDDVLPQG